MDEIRSETGRGGFIVGGENGGERDCFGRVFDVVEYSRFKRRGGRRCLGLQDGFEKQNATNTKRIP
jgi:hypothetical protein